MVTANDKTCCAICNKVDSTMKCEGCLQTFCNNHVAEHRQQLNRGLKDVTINCDRIRDTLTKQKISENHPLMQKINQWEQESIAKIQQRAEETRQLLAKHTIGRTAEIEAKLNNIAKQIQQNREDNAFFETDLQRWKESLIKLNDKLLSQSSNITIREDSTPFISKIYVDLSGKFSTLIKM
jgi:hypothetical protein